MKVCICGRWSFLLVCLGMVLGRDQRVQGAEPTKVAAQGTVEVVDLFEAMAAKQISVRVIPHDASLLNVHIENHTSKKLGVRFPAALVAVPVLEQNLPGFGNGFGNGNGFNVGNGGQNGAQGGGAQPVGAAGPNANNRNAGQNNNRNQNGRNPFGIFNVAPEKIAKIKLNGVCLAYGLRDPRPSMAYELKPLETISSEPGVREVLESLGRGECRQEIAQLAAWHLANDMSWTELEKLKIRRAGSPNIFEPKFPRENVREAQRLVESLPSQKKSVPKTESLSLTQKP